MEYNNNLILPIIGLRKLVLFPSVSVNLNVLLEHEIEAVKKVITSNTKLLVLTALINPENKQMEFDNLYKVGVVAKINWSRLSSDGSYEINVSVIDKVRLNLITSSDNYFLANADIVKDKINANDTETEIAFVRTIKNHLSPRNLAFKAIPAEVLNRVSRDVSSTELANILSFYLDVSLKEKQQLLSTSLVVEKLEIIVNRLNREILIAKIEQEIKQKVDSKLLANQKDFILREKLKVIREELGDISSKDKDIEEIKKKIDENPYPERIKNKLNDELRKYEMTPSASPESAVIRNYIDLLLSLPWYEKNDEVIEIKEVETVLDEDHYGLEKPKERILEYLAVRQFTNSLKAPILCFVGPPGVGKTSLALSISRALKRNLVKISLGGIRDESEVRGHRRTYIGALPGKIIQGMKKAQVLNPVFVLDEIDKLSSDYKGDPASALLEALDPEQNHMFGDHFVEETYDLSQVLFIATGNYLGNIPAALRDRLEIIEMSSYTEIEKLHIAKNHLVPKQAKEHNLDEKAITFTDGAITKLIRAYTKESGVRELERLVAQIYRKLITNHLKENTVEVPIKVRVGEKVVRELLGQEKYSHTKKDKFDQIGLVNGLAYTSYGGDILPIEVNYFNGKGKLVVTGSLGDVMKESANIALNYIKANSSKFKINEDIFNKIDIHIHVPEGAVKKDGPSAGITMATAIVSALTKTPVRHDIAMTGEITLRGNILAIGGLKEKSISAHRSGVKTIVIPQENKKNLEEIPELVKKDTEIVFVNNFEDILNIAFSSEVNTHAAA